MKRKSSKGAKKPNKVQRVLDNPLTFGENYDPAAFAVAIFEDERKEHPDGRVEASKDDASGFMQWLIAPCPLSQFVNEIFDRSPLYVSRSALPNYFDGWHSSVDLKNLLHHNLKYTTNVDVRKYVDGKVHYMNKNDDGSTGLIDPDCVWRRFSEEGCTIRVLHPQRWCDSLHTLMAACERFWGCSTGCNVYLTPPKTQGFPLHYDEIDAFILQVEGEKTWRVYAPKSQEDLLPRNPPLTHFEPGQHGEPVLEVTLTPGDLLYLPRGAPHQALASGDSHSLHITLSTNQYNTWADFLEIALPQAIEAAAKDIPALRQTLPLGFLRYMGIVHQEEVEPVSEERAGFEAMAMGMVNFVMSRLPLDGAADQLGKRLAQERLPPPPVFQTETSAFVFQPTSSKGKSGPRNIQPENIHATQQQHTTIANRVRLTHPDCARLSVEEDTAVVSHHLRNSRLNHMEGQQAIQPNDTQLVFDLDAAPTIEVLLKSGDDGVLLSALPVIDGNQALVDEAVQKLLEAHILEYA